MANYTKEEKARHNGVDTSLWDNDCPRIQVPEGWQDHQHTQQIVRKYLNNDFCFYIFHNRSVIIYLTEEERKVLFSDVPGAWTYLFISHTCLGTCLDIKIRKMNDYEGRTEGLMKVNGGSFDVCCDTYISTVKFLTCTDDHKSVILDNSTVERSVIEALAVKYSGFKNLSNIGIEYALKKNK